jgi:Exopolysaccharide synthesis, ExoD
MRNKNLRKEARERMQDIRADTKKRGPSSRVLEEVIRQAPSEYVTVGWLTSTAPRFVRDSHAMSWTAGDDTGRLYGPRANPRGHGSAVDCGPRQACFPTFHHDARRLPTRQLLRLGGLAMHVLKYLEKVVHPRWPRAFEAAKRVVGVMVLLLTLVLLLTPVPLSNVAPAMVISLIFLAYIEEDGLLLSVGFLAAIILIGLGSAAVWGTIIGATLISV